MDTVWWLIEAFARLVDGFRCTLHLKANCSLGDVADYRAGMAVRFVGFSWRVIHFDDSRAQLAAIERGQRMRERSGMAGLRGRKARAQTQNGNRGTD